MISRLKNSNIIAFEKKWKSIKLTLWSFVTASLNSVLKVATVLCPTCSLLIISWSNQHTQSHFLYRNWPTIVSFSKLQMFLWLFVLFASLSHMRPVLCWVSDVAESCHATLFAAAELCVSFKDMAAVWFLHKTLSCSSRKEFWGTSFSR